MLTFDNGWVVRNDTLKRLESQGYSVAGYTHNGHRYYVLYNVGGLHIDIVYETDNPNELSNYVKLLLGSNDGSD